MQENEQKNHQSNKEFCFSPIRLEGQDAISIQNQAFPEERLRVTQV